MRYIFYAIIITILIASIIAGCYPYHYPIAQPPSGWYQYTYTKCDCIYRGLPEYTGLREEITHREYRLLPSYLQNCYQKKSNLQEY